MPSDLDGRHVQEVSAGRKKEEVTCLLERLTDCEAVEAVSMDMSRAFREAIQLCLPRAHIVADHFHVIQHVSKAVKAVIGRWAKKGGGQDSLRGPSAPLLTQPARPGGFGRASASKLSSGLS